MHLPIHPASLADPVPAALPAAERLPGPGDWVSALILFAVAVLLALAVLGMDWRDVAERDRPVYPNTPVMVIPPTPR